MLRHFQGSRHFARDQRLRLGTPGWRVLDFHGKQLSEVELECQRENIRKGPLLVRDREHPFAEDLITDGAGVVDSQLPVLTKVLCLVDELRMGGSYELIEKLRAQFVLTAAPVKTEISWTRDEVLVGSVIFRNHIVSFLIYIGFFCFQSINVTGLPPRILSRVIGWAKAQHFYILEFEERGVVLRAFKQTWESDTFSRVAVAVTDRFAVDATHELSVGGSVVAAVNGSASLVAVSGGIASVGRHSRQKFGKWVQSQAGRVPSL